MESNRYPTGMGELSTPATLAFPYVPVQQNNPQRYSPEEAMEHGTLFPGLNLPFKMAMTAQTKLTNTALVELMALEFAVDELGLYLTTHPDDKEVLDLYWTYCKLGEEGKKKYEKMYGPLCQTTRPADGTYAWIKDPWPWDEGGSD
ncbi:spore coat protein CotJB [Bengtsoniella intestinalis]|uniref:spore coat protein CotJB n=1 Tax=Bengtsoniella intestinalis TaxID=3073143 RepID=UPI00391F46A7